MTPEVLQKFKIKGSDIKVIARLHGGGVNLPNYELENVAIENALQVEAARCHAVPIHFNTSPAASLKSLTLSVAVLERFYSASA